MPIFSRRKPAEVLAVPEDDPKAHQDVLQVRADAAAAEVRALEARIVELEAARVDHAISGAFEEHAAAEDELVTARAALERVSATATTLREAALEVSAERQRREWLAQADEADRVAAEAMARVEQRRAELPLLVEQIREMCREFLADGQLYSSSRRGAMELRHQVEHFGTPEAQVFPRYGNWSDPANGFAEANPWVRMFANGLWHVGVHGPMQPPQG